MTNATEEEDSPPVHALERRNRLLERELQTARRSLQEVLDSRSFRLTAPLRWLRRKASDSRSDAQPHREAVVPGGKQPPGVSDPEAPWRPLRVDEGLRDLLGVPVEGGAIKSLAGQGASLRRAGAGLRIATLVGKALQEELAFDADIEPLLATTWEAQLEDARFDFLLVETAWQLEGGWGFAAMAGSPRNAALRRVVAESRSRALPVVLWAREAARNFERVAWLGELVDRVYAIDDELALQYRREYPRLPVKVLPPAIQPRIHNPVRSYALDDALAPLSGHVLLDGWWELKRNGALRDALELLGERGVVIDSAWDFTRQDMEEATAKTGKVLGAVTSLEKAAIVRGCAVELRAPGCLTLPWREREEALRAAACGAGPVVAGEGEGRDLASAARNALALADDGLRAQQFAHVRWREAFTAHCLSDRLDEIARDLGIPASTPGDGKVALILPTMRPERLQGCLDWYRAASWQDKELIVVAHGVGWEPSAYSSLVEPGESIRILQLGAEHGLGDCLNYALDQSDASIWMKIDDDDFYGRHYVSDAMLYRRAFDAPVFGKPPAFVYLAEEDELRWDAVWARHAHLLHGSRDADAALVAGGTLGGRRDVLEAVPFSSRRRRGSDSDFIRRCYEHGHDVLAMDSFNFARFRSRQPGFHTWDMPSGQLRERSRLVGQRSMLETEVFI